MQLFTLWQVGWSVNIKVRWLRTAFTKYSTSIFVADAKVIFHSQTVLSWPLKHFVRGYKENTRMTFSLRVVKLTHFVILKISHFQGVRILKKIFTFRKMSCFSTGAEWAASFAVKYLSCTYTSKYFCTSFHTRSIIYLDETVSSHQW